MKAVHASRLDRWLGKENTEHISSLMANWYGPPIALHGVPGNVLALKGGDFVGVLKAGWEMSALDRAEDVARRIKRAMRRASLTQQYQLNAGFASLSDLIAEASVGKRLNLAFTKVGTTGIVSASNSLWAVGTHPVAGAAGSAAPGGRIPTSATTGALFFNNPATGGDTTHFINGSPNSSVLGNTLLLYDRIFDVAKTMNSTATEAVTGVPTRYTNTTANTVDSAEGNFLFVEGGTVLAATAHNWTVCTYVDQSNNAGATLPSVTGNSSNLANRLDHPTSNWFAPLASGDIGIKALTQMQCSAAVPTGTINFVLGHPIAWMPCPIANIVCVTDGLNTAFNLTRVFDNACLAFLEATKPSTTSTTYTGSLTICAG